MSSSTQDSALAPPPPATAPIAGPPAADPATSSHVLDSTQVVQLLRHFPSVYSVSQPILSAFLSLPFLLRAGLHHPVVYESARAVSHMCNVLSSARLHVIRGEVTAGARSRVKSGADGPFFRRRLSLRPQ
jgi:hypothetical protein